MKRLYFVLPDRRLCETIVQELEENGIPERHIHIVAGYGISLEGLPEASMIQKSELAHGIEKGLAMGGVAGLLGGLLTIAFPPAGLVLSGEAVLLMTGAGGAGLGAIVNGLLSKDLHNKQLRSFERDIARGKILLMTDVPRHDVERFRELILEHHPEAEIGEVGIKKETT
ncbi:MAG: DUF1269 domain-containing protein [Gammaproteobacteria bacterium]|jgi:hypothetical protein